MTHQATRQAQESIAGRLAAFFPGGMSVRIPVRVTVVPSSQVLRARRDAPAAQSPKSEAKSDKLGPHKNNGHSDGRQELSENTVIEYGTAREVLFASALPLEFEDRVHLENADGSLQAEAHVVAVQYHDGRMAVAVRFVGRVSNWIIR